MRRSPGHEERAALAANWRTILLVDAVIGVVALGAGLWLLGSGTVVLGGSLGAAGLTYLVANARRRRRWRRLRVEHGIEG